MDYCSDSSKQGTRSINNSYDPSNSKHMHKTEILTNKRELGWKQSAIQRQPYPSWSAPNDHLQVHIYIYNAPRERERESEQSRTDKETVRLRRWTVWLFTLLYSSWLTVVAVFCIIGLLLLELGHVQLLVNHLWNGFNLRAELLFYLVQCKSAHNRSKINLINMSTTPWYWYYNILSHKNAEKSTAFPPPFQQILSELWWLYGGKVGRSPFAKLSCVYHNCAQ